MLLCLAGHAGRILVRHVFVKACAGVPCGDVCASPWVVGTATHQVKRQAHLHKTIQRLP